MQAMKINVLVAALLAVVQCYSQQLFIPRNIEAAYQKGTRSADGRPGKNYWQNTAAYRLDIHFDPSTRLLSGTADINCWEDSSFRK